MDPKTGNESEIEKETSEQEDPPQAHPFTLVGIGASAGGLDALSELFGSLDPSTGMAFVVIQHLDPFYESLLAPILSKHTSLLVIEAKDKIKIQPNCVYTIPPNHHIQVTGEELRLEPRNKGAGPFLPIDYFFRSLASAWGRQAIGIVLSGGGSDGSLGLQEIRAKGGITFVQDEGSAKFDSMPRSAIETGAVDFILSLKNIAAGLKKLAHNKYLTASFTRQPDPTIVPGEELESLLKLVFKATRIDFTNYKLPTVSRRIHRRMALNQIETLTAYLHFLKQNPSEIKALSNDILIQVTKFFRDPEVFEFLKETVFPSILDKRLTDDPIRVWVPACATGEEAYSVLMSLVEYCGESGLPAPLQAFATDLSEPAIIKAREAAYMENALQDVSPERMHRFFTKTDHRHLVKKSLRDHCIFATHNMLTDPPFAKLDLITCRNVLIYLEPPLQKRVLSIFHYALKPKGILILGNAETVGVAPELYEPLDSKHRAYRKKTITNRLYFDFAGTQYAAERVSAAASGTPAIEGSSKVNSLQPEVDRVLISEFVPAGVVVNNNLEVIQFRGSTGPYFEHSPGIASFDLLKMLKEGLVAEVRSAIIQAKDKSERVKKTGLQVYVNGEAHRIALEVFPISAPPTGERFFVLLFEDMDAPDYKILQERRDRKRAAIPPQEDQQEVGGLRAELASTKEYLQSVNEEKEAANEELRAANEEIMSSNEELQSTNEELHTAKEELQSTNEELLTVNDELKNRNIDLSQLSNDLTNLMTSLNVAVVLLTKDLRIRKFTPMAEKIFRFIPGDVGRPIKDIRFQFDIKDLEKKLLEVITTVAPKEMEVKDEGGEWYSVLMRPYRTEDDRIDGVVLLMMNITPLKLSLQHAEAVEDTIGNPFLVLDGDLRVERANKKFYEVFKTTPQETEGRVIYRLGTGQWDFPELRRLLEEILPKEGAVSDVELKHTFPKTNIQSIRLSGRRLFYENQKTETIMLSIEVD